METAADNSQNPAPIKLDTDDCFVAFEMHGHTFECDVWEAGEQLKAIDLKHQGAPEDSEDWLDDVAALLRAAYGVTKCTRRGAWKFYAAIVAQMEELKKTISPTPVSATGSGVTVETGPAPSSSPGSPTSTDCTPNAS